jgi:hypothetical protein
MTSTGAQPAPIPSIAYPCGSGRGPPKRPSRKYQLAMPDQHIKAVSEVGAPVATIIVILIPNCGGWRAGREQPSVPFNCGISFSPSGPEVPCFIDSLRPRAQFRGCWCWRWLIRILYKGIHIQGESVCHPCHPTCAKSVTHVCYVIPRFGRVDATARDARKLVPTLEQ